MANREHLKPRTKAFALRVIQMLDTLVCKRPSFWVIQKQLLRSATSVAANYRSACRARSPAEFCAKMGIVEEESDESAYWIETMIDAGVVKESLAKDLLKEANEITAMVVASIRTAKNPGEKISKSSTPHSALRTPHSSRADA